MSSDVLAEPHAPKSGQTEPDQTYTELSELHSLLVALNNREAALHFGYEEAGKTLSHPAIEEDGPKATRARETATKRRKTYRKALLDLELARVEVWRQIQALEEGQCDE